MVKHKSLFPDTLTCGLRMCRECPKRFLRQRVRDPDMHHGTCVTHVPWCMPGSLTRGFFRNQWWGKRSWRLRNPQFYLCGKRPIYWRLTWTLYMETFAVLSLPVAKSIPYHSCSATLNFILCYSLPQKVNISYDTDALYKAKHVYLNSG